MDAATHKQVTEALDISTADVARSEFERLTQGMSPAQAAQQVLRALRSLEGLQKGTMPEYDAWDALFYAVWFQPVQINLAYTLIREIPRNLNPILTGEGRLQILDIGSGLRATAFGAALAALDSQTIKTNSNQIEILLKESSPSMKKLGSLLWSRFLKEISQTKKYPNLTTLKNVCLNTKFIFRNEPPSARWLLAMHVAYGENAADLKQALDSMLQTNNPRLILTTTHP